MAIQRWDPLRDMQHLQASMNRMFDEALSHTAGSGAAEPLGGTAWKPPTDLFEEPGRYVLRADLPGVAPSDVDIRVEDGHLILRGDRKKDANITHDAYLRAERPEGRFALQISLPSSVAADDIRAVHRNGVLEIVLPKKIEQPAGRIDVAAG